MSLCPHCSQPLPARCPVAGCSAPHRYVERRVSATGLAYQVRLCDAGHRFVMTAAGRTARRYSRRLERVLEVVSALVMDVVAVEEGTAAEDMADGEAMLARVGLPVTRRNVRSE